MIKRIKLTESQLKSIIRDVLYEQNEIDEYGRKGRWKDEWTPEDQMLAMYNSFYGIEELGMNKDEVARDIIGTSVDSFNQQSSNFDFLDGRGGLDRESHKQTDVYEKYKKMPKYEFKKLCLDIIEKRLQNPETSVIKKKIGDEIGKKREEISTGRKEGLLKAGISPERVSKMSMISSRPLNSPVEDDDEPSIKQQITDYLKSIYNRIINATSINDTKSVANDIEFIIDYINTENVISEDVRSPFVSTRKKNK